MTSSLPPWPSRANDALRIWSYHDAYGTCRLVAADGATRRRWFRFGAGGDVAFEGADWAPGKRIEAEELRPFVELVRRLGSRCTGELPRVPYVDQGYVELAASPRVAAHIAWEHDQGLLQAWGPGDEASRHRLIGWIHR